MILIDQDTASLLVARLERIKTQDESARCIYLNLKERHLPSADIQAKVIAAVRHYIPSVDMQIYLCGDGDVFILAPTIPSTGGKEFIRAIAGYLGIPVSEEWACFVELPLNIRAVLIPAEVRLEQHHKAEEEKRRNHEQQQIERKRQAILSGGGVAKKEEIRNRRSTRKTLEIMIIEDDAFSRKLVENALQKQYSLTGLGEATHALDAYARIAPDVLFLDIHLPDVAGHELLEKIIALDPDAYVIMLSGNCDRENITQAMSKGARGFVAKPFTKDKLFQYIERCPGFALKRRLVSI